MKNLKREIREIRRIAKRFPSDDYCNSPQRIARLSEVIYNSLSEENKQLKLQIKRLEKEKPIISERWTYIENE